MKIYTLLFSCVCGNAFFQHAKRTYSHQHHAHSSIQKRTEQGVRCAFPTDAGLVAVTPSDANAGWAMAPDRICKAGMYCPYACPSGQLMAQWDPSSTAYTFPQSTYGGLYCNSDGTVSKPFPEKPYCVEGQKTVKVQNKAKGGVAFCQTVLPGFEDIIIPTFVQKSEVLAVPGPDYWAGTSAHYYVNPPGTSAQDGCIWGSENKAAGNWSPYVVGMNQDQSGLSYVKISWNPNYFEPNVPFRNVVPQWGLRIECDGPCDGIPCKIDPSINNVNQVCSVNSPDGTNTDFCTATVPKGSTARIVVFTAGAQNEVSQASDTSSTSASTNISSITQSSSAATLTSQSTLSNLSSLTSTTELPALPSLPVAKGVTNQIFIEQIGSQQPKIQQLGIGPILTQPKVPQLGIQQPVLPQPRVPQLGNQLPSLSRQPATVNSFQVSPAVAVAPNVLEQYDPILAQLPVQAPQSSSTAVASASSTSATLATSLSRAATVAPTQSSYVYSNVTSIQSPLSISSAETLSSSAPSLSNSQGFQQSSGERLKFTFFFMIFMLLFVL